MDRKKNDKGPGAAFRTGVIAIAFLAMGFQTALFLHKAAAVKIEAMKDRPDTVYIIESRPSVPGSGAPAGKADVRTVRKNYGSRSSTATNIRSEYAPRTCESFPFNPNTISTEDLQRLGFSEKQAQAIDNYRKKGGHFSRKEDFARSYVVADSVYKRLEPYIDIPKIDLNKADSAAFETLPGIGPFYAAKIVEYRNKLGGSYSYPEQLMDLYRFDREKFDKVSDLVTITGAKPYRLWTLPEDSLAMHPYIRKYAAHGIVLYRNNHSPSQWTVKGLEEAGVLRSEDAGKLGKCVIATP